MNTITSVIFFAMLTVYSAITAEAHDLQKHVHRIRVAHTQSESGKYRSMNLVHSRMGLGYKAGIFSLKSTEERIAAYKECMYPAEGRLERAFALNLAVEDDELLYGAPKKLAYEVCLGDAIGLTRFEEQSSIEAGKQSGDLVPLDPREITFSDKLPEERRYARTWVKRYVEQLAGEMAQHFTNGYTELRIGSLVRSFKDQARQRNSPASCKTEICSTHTTGSAVDISIASKWLPEAERSWLKERLLADRKQGKVIFIEERFPPHYHVFVIPSQYLGE